MPRRYPWTSWPASRLLPLRLRDLNLRIEGTWLQECVDQLRDELTGRGITLHPTVWLSDEWFAPDTTLGFAIPFFLAHPRLMRLERNQILEVEGGTPVECLRIMRHEMGHVLQHAYDLNRRRRWQELFGRSSTRYPSYYRPNPTSKKYVQHLRLWYAQAHPDEDFAETFAVWLRPRSNWRVRYARWPALKKLEYVDELMAEIGGTAPRLRSRAQVDPISRIRVTLGEHYEKKRSHYSVQYPDTYDRDLIRLFSGPEGHRRSPTAAAFLRAHRRWIRRMVSRWTGEYELSLDMVLTEMIGRCRELKLRAVGPQRQLRMDFAVLLTVHTMHALYSQSRRAWFAL
ncbi:MAG: putative zinc-binding metallopeptidase [Gemmatimonadota bacterium]